MTEEEMKDLMIDYIDGNLTGELKEFVAKHIEKSPDNRRAFEELKATMELLKADKQLEPDRSMKMQFEEALKKEMEGSDNVKELSSGRSWSFTPWQIAASVALVVSGVFIGMLILKNQESNKQLAELKREMEMTKQLVIQSLDDQTSASRRIQAVNATHGVDRPDDEILKALIRTMNNDDNTNVRLAAVEALAGFADDPEVLSALIASMEKQTDPLVQITLINLMVQLKQKGAVEELQKIIKDDKTIEAVKDEAHMAVFKLS